MKRHVPNSLDRTCRPFLSLYGCVKKKRACDVRLSLSGTDSMAAHDLLKKTSCFALCCVDSGTNELS